jgi:hypothetical protein
MEELMRDPATQYTGHRNDRGELVVTIHRPDGQTSYLPLRLDLRNHSPTGFECGYGGSGPSQLALALLADATGDDRFALEQYRYFVPIIAALDRDKWHLDAAAIWALSCFGGGPNVGAINIG